ncbi:MAG TPA: guanitoxin biosynthesis L-enduracididine beta-hydroxylase GntD [Thermoanaerobaculia bacterium]
MKTFAGVNRATDCKIWLTEDEICSLQGLLQEIAAQYDSVESPEFLAEAALYAAEMPRRVRAALYDFKLAESPCGLLILSGWPVKETIGKTPEHWKARPERSPAFEEEALLVLLGSVLGECIGWSTQQDGHIVHDILPIKGHEGEQLGSGSEQLLWWHCEDAFHPFRGDYLGMLCLRNPDRVPTTFASIQDVRVDPKDLALLFEAHYVLRPDESHLKKNKGDTDIDEVLGASYKKIEQMNSTPDKIAVLYGDPRAPYIRIDPYFMDPVTDHPRAQEALKNLIRAIEGRLRDIVLEAGDFCFIDNFQAVHGRKPFRARYDGNDRWLKRINIARDLRKSRTSRRDPMSRIIL